MQKNILYEDNDILVVYKPAGIATQTARLGQRDMVSELKTYLAKQSEYNLKKEPYLGMIHRLDQPVSGLLVFAKNKQAAADLSKQLTEGKIQKYYYAVVLGKPQLDSGILTDYLLKDGKTNQSRIVPKDVPDAKKAKLEYKCIRTLIAIEADTEVSLLEIKLLTGRHHQIRVQMSNAGMPLAGDGKYGTENSRIFDRQAGLKSVALCAYKLSFIHPVTKQQLTYEKKPEGDIFSPFFAKGV